MILSPSVLLRMRNVPEQKVVEKIRTHILYPSMIFSENSSVYGLMWKNMGEPDRTQTMT